VRARRKLGDDLSRVGLGALVVVLMAAGLATAASSDRHAASTIAIAAAGDIACDPDDSSFRSGIGSGLVCRQLATSNLLVSGRYSGVLTLGDNQYESGERVKFVESYGRSWGRVKAITHPAVGNHDYNTRGAAGYYRYFGSAAGNPATGYYSFDLGAWHLVALNSNCTAVGGCGQRSPQNRWLRADLAAHKGVKCTLAYWHHPRFSSGQHGSDPTYAAFWRALYAANADVVLVGHDHDYERFAPQTANGIADARRGIREFVVGTGGRSLRDFSTTAPNSEVRDGTTFGILGLTLRPTHYSWRFVPAVGSFADAGSDSCH
jgi:acid phosphatase type 7